MILDSIREYVKEDYFNNISHDKKVLEALSAAMRKRWRRSEEIGFSSCPGRQDLFAIRLKETGCLIGILPVTGFKEARYDSGT